MPFPIGGRWSFGTSLNPAVFEILRSKRIGVTSLTFQGHVMSSVTYMPFPIGGHLEQVSISNGIRDIQCRM